MTYSDQFNAWLARNVSHITQAAKEGIKDTADDAADDMKLTIATSGTAKSGRAGRIDTGEMIDSVGSEVLYDTSNTYGARFGYLNGPYWAKFQDQGFVHYLSGETIEGTYALSDAAFIASLEVERNIRKRI